ncbi:hypothetical protein O3M35_012860 [Rhynocoris fuscipes]|uniref:Uncharacterized protein n=1 Tax=Rhynocoris fuscipes TaxID=488301 RepID=A0AAW1CFE9_9HEMI
MWNPFGNIFFNKVTFKDESEPMDVDSEWSGFVSTSADSYILKSSSEEETDDELRYCYSSEDATCRYTDDSVRLISCFRKSRRKKKPYRVTYYPWVRVLNSPGTFEPLMDHENLDESKFKYWKSKLRQERYNEGIRIRKKST